MNKDFKEMKVGVVGQGFVGSSIRKFFEKKIPINTYDINGKCNCQSLSEIVDKSEIIFICLPTPMFKDGSCDLTIIENTVKEILQLNDNKILIIKSTIPPGTTDRLISLYGDSIIFNPEFLTEANAAKDFENQDRVIIGGYGDSQKVVYSFFKSFFSEAKIINCSPKEAELTKYVTNTFLTTKVAFANEIFTLCESLNVDYLSLLEIFTLDTRLGKSHWNVPGPDGKSGFGCSCFPKDINALIYTFNENNVDSPVLEAVWKRNIEIDRKEQDWNNLIGRAVSSKIQND